MSDPGTGYYRHPCIYQLTKECKNWVWQKDDACGECLAKGRPSKRESEEVLKSSPERSLPSIEMSSVGGGYCRYPCYNWMPHGCPFWVWQKDEVCGDCLGKGQPPKPEAEKVEGFASEDGVPAIENGRIRYITVT